MKAILLSMTILVSCGKNTSNYYLDNNEVNVKENELEETIEESANLKILISDFAGKRSMFINGYTLEDENFHLRKQDIERFLKEERAKIKLAEKQLKDIEKMSEEL